MASNDAEAREEADELLSMPPGSLGGGPEEDLVNRLRAASPSSRHEYYQEFDAMTGGALRSVARSSLHDRKTAAAMEADRQKAAAVYSSIIPAAFLHTIEFANDFVIQVIKVARATMDDTTVGHSTLMDLEATVRKVDPSHAAHLMLLLYTENGGFVLEKIAEVTLTPMSQTHYQSAMEGRVIPVKRKSMTMNQFVHTAVKKVGRAKLFKYNPFNGSSADFVNTILTANAEKHNVIYTQDDKRFVMHVGERHPEPLGSAAEVGRGENVVVHGHGYHRSQVENVRRYSRGEGAMDTGGALLVQHITRSTVPWSVDMRQQFGRISDATTPEGVKHAVDMVSADGIKNASGGSYTMPEWLGGLVVKADGDVESPHAVDYKQVYPQAGGLHSNHKPSVDFSKLSVEDKNGLSEMGKPAHLASYWSMV